MIQVWDDLIPPYLQQYFELSCLGQSGESFLHPTVDFHCQWEPTAQSEPTLSFVHLLKSSTSLSSHMSNFGMIAQAAAARAGMTLRDVIQARIFISPPVSRARTYEPHRDLPGEHTVVIYYVNDSTGDTVFYDNSNSVIQTVSPRRGRVVLFDGQTLHAGSSSTTTPRCLVNFDLWTVK